MRPPWPITLGAGALVLAMTLINHEAAGAAPAKTAGKKATPAVEAEYQRLLESGEMESAVKRLLAAFPGPQAQTEMDALGRLLGPRTDQAAAILDKLAASPDPAAAVASAELLVWLARGDETPDWQRKGRTIKPQPMSTEALGRRAGLLLDDSDPFVRGLAEWALSIRLSGDYECAEERAGGRRLAKEWPGNDAPDWYQKWAAIPVTQQMELDYVRQAAALGWHRNREGLLISATNLVNRASALAAHISHRGEVNAASKAQTVLAGVLASQRKLIEYTATAPNDLTGQRKLWLALRVAVREVALSNPDLDFDRILFATRQATPQGGNITAGRWNVHTPGGDIYVKQGLAPEAPVSPLLRGRLGPGHVRGMDLWWEADRLVFAYAKQAGRASSNASVRLRPNSDLGGYFGSGVGEVEEMSHLFEMKLDGSRLRQLTDAPYNADQEPCYLPNGDIVFVSDRSNFGSQCAGALEQDNMILNLYRCDPDGRNIRALSNNKDFDRHPHLMDNGQILFLHWEYQERHLWQTHTLWTCRPDGTMTDALYKQHIETGPMSLREARQIYGQSKLVAVACGHHNWDQGAIFVADYSHGINEAQGMRNVTPGVSGTEGGYGRVKTVPEGGVLDAGGHYMFPYPLSDKAFLAAYSYKRPEAKSGQNFALYYVDVWGNKELIHRDRQLSVAYLMPVRHTPRPPVLPDLPGAPAQAEGQPAATKGQRYAIVSVANAHSGWPDLRAGTIKYLRISQKVPWPCVRDESKACGFNDLHWMPAAWEPVLGMWDWGAARVIGIVPVETDGSAHFKVPADQTVYFHALDENFLELRRMRSNVTFPAGENRSCIGCHESKAVAPPALARSGVTLALRRAPSIPEPPPWGDRIIPDYERHIQPIFDRHCVSCHGEKEPKGGLDFTGRLVDGYAQSYRTIFGLQPGDRTPFAQGFWTIWRPGQPPLSEEAVAYAKTFLRHVLRDPPPAQLVRVADYTGGAEVTLPRQFGSGNSKLTLALLRSETHRKEVRLSREEWISLVTWIDLNAQYWGTFVEKDTHLASRRAGKSGGWVVPPRRVRVTFPDPWERPPAGEWIWVDNATAALKP